MLRAYCERKIRQLLAGAGVTINGKRPWDLRVLDDAFFTRVCLGGSLGLGESYMEGQWECPRLDMLFHRVIRAGLDEAMDQGGALASIEARLFNLQNPSRAFEVGRRHYDMGNELYRLMLDDRMIYSCGYWEHAETLEEAQEAKLDMVCRKLDLQPGMRVLDIGCGWGGAARFAAERYGVEVVGITVSSEQARLARTLVRGLPVEIRLQDYRDLEGTYDRIFSIGMVEHVGYKNYRTFMRTVRRCLEKDGLFLLHTIGGNAPRRHTDPWIERYIFPNSLIPSASQLARAAEGCFVLEDWHCFGQDYDKTLMAWHRNLDDHWGQLREAFGDPFYRMWSYYLLSCAGAFRARSLQVWQLLLSPAGIPGGYVPARHAEAVSVSTAYHV